MLGPATGDGDVGPVSREREGDPPTDSGAAPRDKGDATSEQILPEDGGAIG
jgi:hypothetical protein